MMYSSVGEDLNAKDDEIEVRIEVVKEIHRSSLIERKGKRTKAFEKRQGARHGWRSCDVLLSKRSLMLETDLGSES